MRLSESKTESCGSNWNLRKLIHADVSASPIHHTDSQNRALPIELKPHLTSTLGCVTLWQSSWRLCGSRRHGAPARWVGKYAKGTHSVDDDPPPSGESGRRSTDEMYL